MTLERITYNGWPNCWHLTDGGIDLIVTADVGPRIIRCGWQTGPNLFVELPEHAGLTGGDAWRFYGGHRFWIAPEAVPRTYLPDNAPVAVTPAPDGAGLHLAPPVEAATGLQKDLTISLGPKPGQARVTHGLTNHGLWPVELAAWAVSAMAPGGVAVVPLPPRGSHPENLLPTSALVLWPYTDLADPRWVFGRRHVLLHGDPNRREPQKLGALVPDGWVAYAHHDVLFVKRFAPLPGAAYPDLGAQVELFTDGTIVELETLGPLTRLEPGQRLTYTEQWALFPEVPRPQTDAEAAEQVAARAMQVASP